MHAAEHDASGRASRNRTHGVNSSLSPLRWRNSQLLRSKFSSRGEKKLEMASARAPGPAHPQHVIRAPPPCISQKCRSKICPCRLLQMRLFFAWLPAEMARIAWPVQIKSSGAGKLPRFSFHPLTATQDISDLLPLHILIMSMSVRTTNQKQGNLKKSVIRVQRKGGEAIMMHATAQYATYSPLIGHEAGRVFR